MAFENWVSKIFDSHFHIIDSRFPLVPNNGYLPPEFTAKNYLARIKNMHIAGGAIVSGSFQAFDQGYLLAALKELGPRFVGVTQLAATASDKEILQLNSAGVRAVRFNMKRGGSESIEKLESFAQRVYKLAKWHIELYVDSRLLSELTPTLRKLPAVSIDHLGLSKAGLPDLLSLVEHGVKVKATGFSRVDFDVKEALRAIARTNPNSLMFGTDLPSTRAPRPFSDSDIDLIKEALDGDLLEKALYENAVQFYRPSKI